MSTRLVSSFQANVAVVRPEGAAFGSPASANL
jgi:hypothetical protein